jgi:hypothetical protein
MPIKINYIWILQKKNHQILADEICAAGGNEEENGMARLVQNFKHGDHGQQEVGSPMQSSEGQRACELVGISLWNQNCRPLCAQCDDDHNAVHDDAGIAKDEEEQGRDYDRRGWARLPVDLVQL